MSMWLPIFYDGPTAETVKQPCLCPAGGLQRSLTGRLSSCPWLSSLQLSVSATQSLLHHHLYFFKLKFKELKRKTANVLLNYSKVFLQNIAGRISVAMLKYIEIFIVFKMWNTGWRAKKLKDSRVIWRFILVACTPQTASISIHLMFRQ